ncbi:LysE family translocator [Pseudaquabacterium rugosum]|jgi:threonine/homoserine/homoserine lactone efflux protein|uniref:LysE family transporter n=1 Tax=Pseudaquabacterium rugosum TaxID=2984194 RepID=A0ABU9B8W3_9BURK
MYGIHDYPGFVLAVIVFLAIPGPGNLALITSTGQGGVRGGLAAAGGVIAGDQLLMWTAVAGLAAVLSASPRLFHLLQWGGAVYLAWLGLKMLRARPGAAPTLQMRPGHWFRQSMTITLLNPKAVMFYMAFFPLFVDPATHRGLPTFALMAVTIATLTLAYCAIVIALTRHFADRLRASPRVGTWLQRTGGGLLLAFGLKLALGR